MMCGGPVPNKLTQQCTECITLFHNPSVRHSQHTYVRTCVHAARHVSSRTDRSSMHVRNLHMPSNAPRLHVGPTKLHTHTVCRVWPSKQSARSGLRHVRTYVRSHIVNYVRSFLHVRAYARTYVGTYVCFLSRTVCHIAAAAEMVATCLRLTYVRACRNQLLSQRK